MARKTIDPALKAKIIRYLKSHSQNKTAEHFDISPSTVNKIANAGQTEKPFVPCSEPKKATDAHVAYAKERRKQLFDKFLMRLEEMLNSKELKPGQMQGLAIATGTILDKYRLEEGSSGEGKAALLVLAEQIAKNAEAAKGAAVRSS
jgi:hypothetical protein